MKSKLVVFLTVLILLSTLSIAYKEEIKQVSEKAIEKYIQQIIKTLPEDDQKEFEQFKELSIDKKIKRSWQLNSKEDR